MTHGKNTKSIESTFGNRWQKLFYQTLHNPGRHISFMPASSGPPERLNELTYPGFSRKHHREIHPLNYSIQYPIYCASDFAVVAELIPERENDRDERKLKDEFICSPIPRLSK